MSDSSSWSVVYRSFPYSGERSDGDLLYLFWAITTGITTGAGMYALALIAAVVMIANVEDITLIQYNGEYHG